MKKRAITEEKTFRVRDSDGKIYMEVQDAPKISARVTWSPAAIKVLLSKNSFKSVTLKRNLPQAIGIGSLWGRERTRGRGEDRGKPRGKIISYSCLSTLLTR